MENQEQWHAVAGSSDIGAGMVRGVNLLGYDLAVWRGENGEVNSWENRCPHRGMRLSYGQVRNNNLCCRYHGWEFSQTGCCEKIPSAVDGSVIKNVRSVSYPTKEQSGLIWINLSAENDSFNEFINNSSLTADYQFCKSIYIDGELAQVAEKLMSYTGPFSTDKNNNKQLNSNLIQLGDNLIIGIQDYGNLRADQKPKRLGLHVSFKSKSNSKDEFEKLLEWVLELRWDLENPTENKTAA